MALAADPTPIVVIEAYELALSRMRLARDERDQAQKEVERLRAANTHIDSQLQQMRRQYTELLRASDGPRAALWHLAGRLADMGRQLTYLPSCGWKACKRWWFPLAIKLYPRGDRWPFRVDPAYLDVEDYCRWREAGGGR